MYKKYKKSDSLKFQPVQATKGYGSWLCSKSVHLSKLQIFFLPLRAAWLLSGYHCHFLAMRSWIQFPCRVVQVLFSLSLCGFSLSASPTVQIKWKKLISPVQICYFLICWLNKDVRNNWLYQWFQFTLITKCLNCLKMGFKLFSGKCFSHCQI